MSFFSTRYMVHQRANVSTSARNFATIDILHESKMTPTPTRSEYSHRDRLAPSLPYQVQPYMTPFGSFGRKTGEIFRKI